MGGETVTMLTAILWKEWRETVWQHRLLNAQVFPLILVVLIAGVLVPVGLALTLPVPKEEVLRVIQAVLLIVMPLGGFLYAVGTAVDAIAGERERHTLETLIASPAPNGAIVVGKILAVVIVGVVAAAAMGWLNYVTVVILYGFDDTSSHLLLAFFGPLLAIFPGLLVASLGFLISYRARTVKGAQTVLGLTFMPVFFLLGLAPSVLVPRGGEAAPGLVAVLIGSGVVLLVAPAVLFVLAIVLFRRDRLLAP